MHCNADLTGVRLGQFKASFAQLRVGLEHLRGLLEESDLLLASRFNLFRILGVERLEVTTHSAFLVSLLDPHQFHGQKTLFLRKFIDICKKKKFGPFFPLDDHFGRNIEWTVKPEMLTPQGKMDIVVLAESIGFLLVIENKIDAGEQESQLERYWQWMQTQREKFPNRILIYLTIAGINAYSMKTGTYYKMSYREDIVDWLRHCIPEVKAERVRDALRQYENLVINL